MFLLTNHFQEDNLRSRQGSPANDVSARVPPAQAPAAFSAPAAPAFQP